MRTLALFLLLLPSLAFSQWGIAYHQSNLPFIGINYEATSRIRPEFRLGTDQYYENLSLEAVVTYDLVKQPEYDLYAGLGIRTNQFSGLVVPIGANLYPFAAKRFGFHIELAPIINENSVLRGSWGIRYRFRKRE